MFSPWSRPSHSIPELATTQEFDGLAQEELTMVFKHSPTCPVSLYAHQEVIRFRASKPEVPVYLVSVRRRREVAQHIADQTGVTHESPQILVFRRGEVIAAASHEEITADWLEVITSADQRATATKQAKG